MIDSGAHTFISDYTKFTHWKRADFEKYVEDYTSWLRANKQWIFCAVELDIDYCLNMVLGGSPSSTIGTSIVESWQKKYFKPLEAEGMSIIYVWHVERKLEGWEEMCAKFSYVGLPGEMSSNQDFNKYMTVARRYTTKVHGFGATKQLDYRDISWYSIDSTTWKSSERYGILIHWDDRMQKLVMEDDKSKRDLYRASFEKYGLDADGIIRDTNYKEVTKYALISMSEMEKFYQRKYEDRTFYYELRLPSPYFILNQMRSIHLWAFWRLMRPQNLFKNHSGEKDPSKVKMFLAALSAAQNGDDQFIKTTPPAEAFLAAYFPKLIRPLITDMVILQKELASYISPPNPPALSRDEPSLYVPQNNPPKEREAVNYTLEDLEGDDKVHFELSDLID